VKAEEKKKKFKMAADAKWGEKIVVDVVFGV
jgi:hypothetical protein